MENGGFMDNFFVQNTIPLACFYLQRVLGGRYHSNEITCLKLKVKKPKLSMTCFVLRSKCH